MFTEDRKDISRKKGWIEVICGSMFSGKTEELIRRLKRARLARQQVEIYKPVSDKRYDERKVVSHDDNRLNSTPVSSASDIPELAGPVDVVAIDEAQFFDSTLVDACNKLANRGIRVIVAGLDMDYAGLPFGPVPALMAVAEYITKVHAICMHCGEPANFSHRISGEQQQILLGEKDRYEPLCRNCFDKAVQREQEKPKIKRGCE